MDSSLPPVVIEFQQVVNRKFMKRAVGYCIQADKRFEVDPIVLVVCINSLCITVKNDLENCNTLPCYAAPCDYWADRCYIVDKNSIKNHIASNPGLESNLDPFAIYCLFLTNQATSIDLAPAKENTTMQMLHNLSQIEYAKLLDKDASVIEELNNFNDICCKRYEKFLAMLTDDSLSRSTIKGYASQSLQYSIQQKRKLVNIASEDNLSADQDSDEPIETEELHKYMNFAKNFKEEKHKKGITMGWKLCLEEGKTALGWKYKNKESLRSQFSKYKKKKAFLS